VAASKRSGAKAVLPESRTLLEHGRSVVAIEAAALSALVGSIDDSFAAAVNTLMATQGRIVVTGIGKAGHIAGKIASTMASTGSPALFIHPAEAAHGDLGMIAADDTLLILSQSGETAELRFIMDYAIAMGIPRVAIGSYADSSIMRQADIRLVLPSAREACSENLSPTTSAVLMLALGDALAMTMMEVRGSARARIQTLHPGGNIGQRLARISSVMHRAERLPLVPQDASMPDVIVKITAFSFGVAGVVDEEGRLIGIITDGDLRRHVTDLLDRTACEVMTRDPVTITSNCLADEALRLMNLHKITSLFAVDPADPGRPVGLVHIHDFLRQGLR
jgi:arabinose-5-phosphate isomerase